MKDVVTIVVAILFVLFSLIALLSAHGNRDTTLDSSRFGLFKR